MTSIISKPKLDPIAEKAWYKDLYESSEIIDGDDLYEAEIIFLGHNHFDPLQDQYRGAVIDHCGSNGDIVICEGVPAFKQILSTKGLPFFCKTKVACFGWDDPEHFARGHSAIRVIFELNTKYGSTDINKIPSKDREALSEAGRTIKISSVERSSSLIKTAKVFLSRLKPNQKIFVIAGSDHLYDEPYNVLGFFTNYKASLLIPLTFGPEMDYCTYYGPGMKEEDNRKKTILTDIFDKTFPKPVLSIVLDYSTS
jgi:hypothetical protein